jgi:YesN/AraC family two-component response regulator
MAKGKKVLYVDDEFVNLQLFKFNFQKDFELYLANSGKEALDIIKNEGIQVIITDLKMPEMNGIELVENIKNQFDDKICMVLSAYYISEAIDMGLNETLVYKYIVKPWNKKEIINYLNQVFDTITQH